MLRAAARDTRNPGGNRFPFLLKGAPAENTGMGFDLHFDGAMHYT
ncbi:hypothetical protein SAMN03159448_05015 [Sinorhizobium sp. NFACC03]|nr:hypothetical protein SAMN03159448_05015 [Sinorhizobium sp. NFACC03]